MQLLAESKTGNVMFAVGYPYESVKEMRDWFETVPVSDETWKDIGYRNAIRWFGLPLDYDELAVPGTKKRKKRESVAVSDGTPGN